MNRFKNQEKLPRFTNADLQEWNSEEAIRKEYEAVVQKALAKMDKRQCFEDLKQYYKMHGHFPNNHYIHVPLSCSHEIKHEEFPRIPLDDQLIRGVVMDTNGFYGGRVYLTAAYFTDKDVKLDSYD